MKKFMQLTMAAVLILGVMVSAGCGSKAETPAAAEKKILKVGTEATYAPFEFTDDAGNITGFDAELIDRRKPR